MEKDFDSKMQDATIKAKARLEAERLYTAELKENHGKPKSYFIAPTLSSSRRGRRLESQLDVQPKKLESKS